MTIHPQVVHFPIALLLVGSLLTLLTTRYPHAEWRTASRLLLRWGWWGTLLASATGLIDIARDFAFAQTNSAWVNAHVATSLLIVGLYWHLQPKTNTAPRLILHLFGIILIITTGWLGGYLAHTLK